MNKRLLRMSAGVVVGLVACLGCAGTAAAAGLDSWTQWTASPQDTWIRSLDFTSATTLVAGGENDGVFQAATAVGPWVQTNTGLDSVGAKSVHQVVASGGKLYAATSAGLFTAVQGPNPSWSQLGGGTGDNKLNMGGIQSVIVQSPANLVVAVAGAGGPGVYTSSDGGSTWTHAGGMPPGENIYNLTTGTGGAVIYAAGDGGVWTSVSGGTSWTLTSDGINPAETAFRVSAASPTEIWAATGSNVYKSENAGLTWVPVDGSGQTALPAGGVKEAFLLTPTFGLGRALVGTQDGVYASIDGGQNWGQMSTDIPLDPGGFAVKGFVEALGLGFTPPSLLAGTRGYGVFSLPMTPVSGPATFAVSPSSNLAEGTTMTAPTNGWNGTLPFFFAYQWKKCSTANCTPSANIPGATGPTYTIPNDDAGTSTRYAVTVCATNLVSPNQVCKTSSATTGAVGVPPGVAPVPRSGGPASSLTPDPHVSYPWGTTFTINEGAWGTSASPGVAITPDSFTYQWQRCDDSAVCSVIQGATGKTYTSTANDVGYHIAGFVQAHRNAPNASSSDLIEADETFTIIEKTPVNTALPRILGSAVVGTTLQSTAGAWDAHSPTFTRRWLRCGADGLDCQPLQPDQTGTTYTLTDADVGSTIELEVTATQADPSQNRVTVADSKPTAVVTKPSSPPPPPTPPAIKLAKPHKVSVGTKLHGPTSVSGFTIVGYQWLRNGKAIKGATKSTYKITRKDRGKKISLRLTLKRVADGATFTVVSSAIKVPKAHKKHHRHRHHHRRR